jgi:hypothetical protein
MKEPTVPTYGLIVINNAYNEGQITFLQWLELSKAWAEAMIEQFGDNCQCCNTQEVDSSTDAA